MKLKDLKNYKDLLFKYEEKENINGDFHINNLKLTSLEGCPKLIKGTLYCTNNNLKNPIQEIIEKQIEAKKYVTDLGIKDFSEIKENFEIYRNKLLNQMKKKQEIKKLNNIDYGLSI